MIKETLNDEFSTYMTEKLKEIVNSLADLSFKTEIDFDDLFGSFAINMLAISVEQTHDRNNSAQQIFDRSIAFLKKLLNEKGLKIK